MISRASSSDPERLQRFEREARAVAALSHPNVIAIFDVGFSDLPFLVMSCSTAILFASSSNEGPSLSSVPSS